MLFDIISSRPILRGLVENDVMKLQHKVIILSIPTLGEFIKLGTRLALTIHRTTKTGYSHAMDWQFINGISSLFC